MVYWLHVALLDPPLLRVCSAVTVGLILTALGLGLRHGVDWDHIAAIADLSSTAESRRRGVFLSTLYALGHAAVVLVLGVLAILFGSALPAGADVWMGRVVGATLVALGAWVLIELIRKGRDFRLRSRWILVFNGTFAGLRRVREARARRRLIIEHDHVHDHPAELAHEATRVALDPSHDHAHGAGGEIDVQASVPVDPLVTALAGAAVTGPRHPHWFSRRQRDAHGHSHGLTHSHSQTHRHSHSHETVLVDGVAGTGNGAAAGIGLLHGIGFESPTQIAVFVASTSIGGVWAGLTLLVAWVVGLVVANTGLSVLAAFGLLGAERNFAIYATIAVFVAVASLLMGAYLLVGVDPPLPALN